MKQVEETQCGGYPHTKLIQYYRITALEKKSSQGATLSPVKLWSGNLHLTAENKLTLPESALKYNVFQICCILFTEAGFVLTRGQTTGVQDDINNGQRCGCRATISTNIITFEPTGWDQHTNGAHIKEIWGIG